MFDPTLMAKIRWRAYEIWQGEGCPEGRHRIHWVRAEAEFREKLRAQQPAASKIAAHHLERDHVADGLKGTEARNVPRPHHQPRNPS